MAFRVIKRQQGLRDIGRWPHFFNKSTGPVRMFTLDLFLFFSNAFLRIILLFKQIEMNKNSIKNEVNNWQNFDIKTIDFRSSLGYQNSYYTRVVVKN